MPTVAVMPMGPKPDGSLYDKTDLQAKPHSTLRQPYAASDIRIRRMRPPKCGKKLARNFGGKKIMCQSFRCGMCICRCESAVAAISGLWRSSRPRSRNMRPAALLAALLRALLLAGFTVPEICACASEISTFL